jgi:hypothetical protein
MSVENNRETIAVLLHSNYLANNAGVEKVVLEQQILCNDLNMDFVAIFPIIKVRKIHQRHIYIKSGNFKLVKNGIVKGEYKFEEIINLLTSMNIKSLLIHHFIGYKLGDVLIDFVKMFQCPIFYYIHDYATICSNHTLLKNNKRFCGSEGIKFTKCFNCRFYYSGIKRVNFYKKFFEECRNIQLVFPSETIKTIWLGVYGKENEDRCHVVPNQKFSKETTNIKKDKTFEKIKIAYIGYQNRVKGWEAWKKICNLNKEVLVPFVLGSCHEILDNVQVVNVSFIENGPNAMIDAIINNDIDIAFLWSTRPETYGYTFYESYIGGSFILTNNDSGNISHMTKKLDCGKSFDSEQELINYLSNVENVRNDLKKHAGKYPNNPKNLITNDYIFKLIDKFNEKSVNKKMT